MATLQINGKSMKVDAPEDTPLLWVLRDVLGLTGTKFGCGMALAAPAPSISTAKPCAPARRRLGRAGKKITTIEGVGATTSARRCRRPGSAIDVPQCGYCQAGQIMSAAALLEKNP